MGGGAVRFVPPAVAVALDLALRRFLFSTMAQLIVRFHLAKKHLKIGTVLWVMSDPAAQSCGLSVPVEPESSYSEVQCFVSHWVGSFVANVQFCTGSSPYALVSLVAGVPVTGTLVSRGLLLANLVSLVVNAAL